MRSSTRPISDNIILPVKFFRHLYRRLPWLNFPAAALVALLQRTPLLRLLAPAETLVTASPMAHVLRSTFAVGASLGAVHSLAGATQFSLSTTAVSATAGTAAQTVAFSVTGAQTPAGSYRISNLPPGMTVPGATTAGVLNASTGVISGTPTTAGTYRTTILAYEHTNASGDAYGPATITYTITAAAAVKPVFTQQPTPSTQTVATGATVAYTVVASGTPTPTYQWQKDGVAITGATAATLTLTNVQVAASGAYTVLATNSAGSTASETATLTVNAPAVSVPVFTVQPTSLTINTGGTVVLNSNATGATSYQWQLNEVNIPNATTQNLVITPVTAAHGGTYRVVARNTAGPVTSSAATLTVGSFTDAQLGRLINLSVLNNAGSGTKILTVGAVVGPTNLTASLPLVVRGIGPTLGTFGVAGVLADPTLSFTVLGASTPLVTNDDWGGSTVMANAFSAVGAFALPAASADSAVLRDVTPGGYTVQIAGKGTASGTVIAEIYDASSATTRPTQRLINLSSLTSIDAGGTLAVGFVLRGSTARTVLVRGVGPTLGTVFGLGGVLADPKLELFNNDTGAKINENDNWGGDDQLKNAAAVVGAFGLADTATKDAVLLVTLPPGAYSARVSGVGTSAGTAIVEVYEVP